MFGVFNHGKTVLCFLEGEFLLKTHDGDELSPSSLHCIHHTVLGGSIAVNFVAETLDEIIEYGELVEITVVFSQRFFSENPLGTLRPGHCP